MEALGSTPDQFRAMFYPLLRKPKGGFRGIALFASLLRVGTRAREEYAIKWDRGHRRDYFARSVWEVLH